MNGKRIVIGAKPPASPQAEAWVRMGEGADAGKGDLYTARLTLDVTPALRARMRGVALIHSAQASAGDPAWERHRARQGTRAMSRRRPS